jgi:hypothetical protein
MYQFVQFPIYHGNEATLNVVGIQMGDHPGNRMLLAFPGPTQSGLWISWGGE